jgi:hypothetical protein
MHASSTDVEGAAAASMEGDVPIGLTTCPRRAIVSRCSMLAQLPHLIESGVVAACCPGTDIEGFRRKEVVCQFSLLRRGEAESVSVKDDGADIPIFAFDRDSELSASVPLRLLYEKDKLAKSFNAEAKEMCALPRAANFCPPSRSKVPLLWRGLRKNSPHWEPRIIVAIVTDGRQSFFAGRRGRVVHRTCLK